jgi:epoxyqueuosine reductase
MNMDVAGVLQPKIAPHGLFVMGHVSEADHTLVLIGADNDFWDHFRNDAEYSDRQADPIDRWSKRIINRIAARLDGTAVFPSDGPPYAPFISWATQSGRFWQSPTGMLVHDTAGLMISIRGAMKLPFATQAQQERPSPCDSCVQQPCATACPVSALSTEHFYDVPRCKAHLATSEGTDCMTGGCLVRQICPLSQSFNRPAEQSAFHMKAFMPK